MKVVAVVVTYNRLGMLRECIECLRNQTVSCDILIVDNHSNDGTGEYLRENSGDKLYYLDTGANLGGAGGFFHGMNWACNHDYDAAWIMDDDCFPKEDALEKLLDADEVIGGSGEYGFLASAVLWTDGHECCMNRQKIVKDFYRHVEWMKEGIVQINQATFVSLLFPVSTIREFGLPIKEYFIWGDDIEYTRRIALRGKKPSYLAGQSQVVHAMKENTGSDVSIDKAERIARYRLAYRNEAYTYRRQGFKGILLYLARCARGILRVILHAKDHRLKRIGAVLGGMVRGIFFHPKVQFPYNEKQ